jgi:hypothetical protein
VDDSDDWVCAHRPKVSYNGRSAGVPTSWRGVGPVLFSMWDEGLGDVEGLNKHLPSRVVDAEDSLVLLDIVFSLL